MDDHVTGTMFLDSNELDQQPAHTFLTKWTFNNKSCGTDIQDKFITLNNYNNKKCDKWEK